MLTLIVFSIIFLVIVLIIISPKNRWNYTVVFYVTAIIQKNILGQNELFGFIGITNIASAILIIVALSEKNIVNFRWKFIDTTKQKALLFGVFVLLILPRYVEIKQTFLFDDYAWGLILKRAARVSMDLYAIYLLIKRMYHTKTIIFIENGIFIGITIATLSAFFSDTLLSLGFAVHIGNADDFTRTTGFLGMDPNEAATLYGVIYGYILGKLESREKNRKIYYLTLIPILLGFANFASKTGMAIVVLLTLIFAVRSRKYSKNAWLKISGLGILLFITYLLFGSLLKARMDQQISGEHDTLESRFDHWELFTQDLMNNPHYLIIGNWGRPTYYRDAHNFYIKHTFYAGIFSMIYLLLALYKIYKSNKKNVLILHFSILFSIIAQSVGWFTMSSFCSYWFLIIIAMSSGILNLQINSEVNN